MGTAELGTLAGTAVVALIGSVLAYVKARSSNVDEAPSNSTNYVLKDVCDERHKGISEALESAKESIEESRRHSQQIDVALAKVSTKLDTVLRINGGDR